MLQSTGSQRAGHNLATEPQQYVLQTKASLLWKKVEMLCVCVHIQQDMSTSQVTRKICYLGKTKILRLTVIRQNISLTDKIVSQKRKVKGRYLEDFKGGKMTLG